MDTDRGFYSIKVLSTYITSALCFKNFGYVTIVVVVSFTLERSSDVNSCSEEVAEGLSPFLLEWIDRQRLKHRPSDASSRLWTGLGHLIEDIGGLVA